MADFDFKEFFAAILDFLKGIMEIFAKPSFIFGFFFPAEEEEGEEEEEI